MSDKLFSSLSYEKKNFMVHVGKYILIKDIGAPILSFL